jgi:hypothetical protein
MLPVITHHSLSNDVLALWCCGVVLCCQVFLREHSRGLYSAFLHWLIDDIPLLLLRTIQGFMYAGIVHEMLKLDKEGQCQ